MSAQELLEELNKLKDEFGSLEDVPVYVFVRPDVDRHPIETIDIFHDEPDRLHSIDLDIWI